jgi:hypothetical protein
VLPLYLILRIERGQTSGNFGYPDYRGQTDVVSGVTAEATASLSYANANGKTERIRGAVVSGNYFSVLGVTAAAGRLIRYPALG